MMLEKQPYQIAFYNKQGLLMTLENLQPLIDLQKEISGNSVDYQELVKHFNAMQKIVNEIELPEKSDIEQEQSLNVLKMFKDGFLDKGFKVCKKVPYHLMSTIKDEFFETAEDSKIFVGHENNWEITVLKNDSGEIKDYAVLIVAGEANQLQYFRYDKEGEVSGYAHSILPSIEMPSRLKNDLGQSVTTKTVFERM